jgi:hypothetical protein
LQLALLLATTFLLEMSLSLRGETFKRCDLFVTI